MTRQEVEVACWRQTLVEVDSSDSEEEESQVSEEEEEDSSDEDEEAAGVWGCPRLGHSQQRRLLQAQEEDNDTWNPSRPRDHPSSNTNTSLQPQCEKHPMELFSPLDFCCQHIAEDYQIHKDHQKHCQCCSSQNSFTQKSTNQGF